MSPDDFKFVSEMLMQKSGLVLGEEKAYLIENRLMPLVRQHQLSSIEALIAKLRTRSIPGLAEAVTEVMTTNESLFFRDTRPFQVLSTTVLPQLEKARASRRSLRIWSAAASTGQEPYSIAMTLCEERPKFNGWNIEILGTDLSHAALDRAKEGVYSQFEVQRGMSAQMLLKYFSKKDDKWKINPDIAKMARFDIFNLLDNPSRFGTFDIIFCRNVLIYFDKETKSAVLNRISKVLAPDGFLFLGAAETILGLNTAFQPYDGSRGVYRIGQAAMAS